MSPSRPSDDQLTPSSDSALRGDLASNDLDDGLHNLGGDIGPASDATAAADPSEPGDDLQRAQTHAVETGAVAVDSPASAVGRDDPDDAAGGDTSGSPHAAS
jgi:hypothetical protein